jgi:hypothetical protein
MDTKSIEHAIIGNQQQVFQQSLRNQHAVERIAMPTRQGTRQLSMLNANG